jgi:polygalacturonase
VVLLAGCARVTSDGAPRENANAYANGRSTASQSVELPRIPDRRCSLAEHGVKADGTTNDTPAINKAIAACSAAGGGTLSFPAGTYLAASVRLQSKVRLQLEAGATLKAAAEGFEPPEPNPFDKYQDFGHSHFRNGLLWGEDISDVAIEGPGTIDGTALKTGDPPAGLGDKQISIKRGTRLLFRNLTQNSGGHFFYLLSDSEHVTMTGLNMTKGRDGIDLMGCRKVDLSNLRILGCGDDTIALKSDYATGKRLLTEDVNVRDSVVESGCNGLQFGSETAGDFRRIRFSRIQVLRSGKAGIGIQTNDGGVIEDVVFEDITIKKAANPIFINTTKRFRTPEKVGPGRVRNVVIRNVTVTEIEQTHRREPINAATISGLPEAPHENILLENVTITYPGGGSSELASVNPPYATDYNPRMLGPRPAYGFYVRHVRGLVFRNVKVGFENADPRPAFAISDVAPLTLERVTAARAPEGAHPSLRLKDVRDLTIRDSTPFPALQQAALTEASY